MIHITKGSGKMTGVYSINTSTLKNTFCQKMAKGNTVCKSCYAGRYEKLRPNITKAFLKNEEVLLSKDFQPEPLSFKFVRLHSYGELHNTLHFTNYLKLAEYNPNTIFSLWSKRKSIIQGFISKGGIIPTNVILIYSNPLLDNPIKRVPKGFDKVFNVFTKEYIEKEQIVINCKQSCIDCQLCYSLNNVKVINEKKK